jgi:hypothetical protein
LIAGEIRFGRHSVRSATMRAKSSLSFHMVIAGLAMVMLLCSFGDSATAQTTGKAFSDVADRYAAQLLKEGKQIFRYDTFGSEDFWGGQLKLHQAIQGEKSGGVGPGVSPKKALELGLKVDMEAVPRNVAAAIKAGKVDLNDPANTLLLLKANAVLE